MVSNIDAAQRQRISAFLGIRELPLQLRLDVLDVLTYLRPAARVLVRPEAEAKQVCGTLLELGLSISVGSGVKWQPITTATTCHDWFSEGTRNGALEPMAILYIGRTDDDAASARGADETTDDRLFANALGYPSCCISWVCDRGRVPEIGESISLYAPDGKYDPLVWPGAMILDAPLTAHYPCSTSCDQSRDAARTRISVLSQLGQTNILRHILNARKMVYFLDTQSNLKTAPAESFQADWSMTLAVPSMSSEKALGIYL
jgi:hypothetical protein